jgi:hypothetical protein
MSISKKIFRFFVFLMISSFIAIAPALSQPQGGGDQQQMGQNNQMSQGGPGGGQMQGGPMGQMGQNTQSGNQTQQGQGQGFARGQGMQPEQMQTQISQRIKELLGSSDDEWKLIEPKVLKVFTLTSSQSRGFQMRSLMMRANNQAGTQTNTQANTQANTSSTQRANAGNRVANSASDKAVEELQTLLQNSSASSAQIKKQLTEVRNAREKTQEALAKAQKELRELLTLKQEAILVSVGLLE